MGSKHPFLLTVHASCLFTDDFCVHLPSCLLPNPQLAPEETAWSQCPKLPETATDRDDNLILDQMNWAQHLSLSSQYAQVKDRGPLLRDHLCNRSL